MHNLTKIKVFRILLYVTYPFSLIFLLPAAAMRKKWNVRHFFFFDRYAIGGAQKVHLDILESISDLPKIVFFTRLSPNDKMKKSFYSFKNTRCFDIHFWCDNLLFRLFSVHYYAFLVNRYPNAVVLSSNSTFFYDMVPFLNKHVKKIELLHNFSYGKNGMEFFGLANYRYLDLRLVIDTITFQNILEQYHTFNVPKIYFDRVQTIEYGVPIPPPTQKPEMPPLNILYAGRGSKQKRIWLLNRIAEYFIQHGTAVTFTFAGSMGDELSPAVKAHCKVLTEVGEKTVMDDLFSKSHVIILTSSFEGFPVVVKEGMSFGCVPLVTALPGNKTHLVHDFNALLLDDVENEDSVVNHAINNIEMLLNNLDVLERLSKTCYDYAAQNFSKNNFLKTYRHLLLS
jgi:glycosyltransferase involved in cell wall biosynthesis